MWQGFHSDNGRSVCISAADAVASSGLGQVQLAVRFGDQLMQVGEADVAVLQRRFQVTSTELLHVGEDFDQFVAGQVEGADVA